MNFRSVTVGRVYLMSWTAAPEAADLERSQQDIERLRATVRDRVFQLMIVPATASIPTPRIRKQSMELCRELLETHLEAIDLVLVGDDLRGSAMRSMLRAMMLMAPSVRGQMFIHGTLLEALGRIQKVARLDVPAILQAAEQL